MEYFSKENKASLRKVSFQRNENWICKRVTCLYCYLDFLLIIFWCAKGARCIPIPCEHWFLASFSGLLYSLDRTVDSCSLYTWFLR